MKNRYRPHTKPFPHQAKGTMRLIRQRNHGLFMEPRLGKTKAALDAAAMLAQAGRAHRFLVMGPYLAGAWEGIWIDQIRQHFPFTAYCENHEETWVLNRKRGGPRVKFYFLHYERFRTRKRGKRGYTYPLVREVERWGPQVVVLDESHRLKRAGGVAAQAAWRLVRRLRKKADGPGPRQPWVWELSGTANPKGWIDLFAQFRIMDESIYGTNKGDFEEEYVVYGQGARQYTILRYQNVTRLVRKARENSYTCSAEEAGLAGEQFWQKLSVTLPPKARKAYVEMAEEFITELEEGTVVSASNAAVKRLRLLQITGGYTTDGRQIHGEKLAVLEAYAADLLEQEEHFVVYARYRPEVSACVRRLERVGYPVAGLQGGLRRGTVPEEVRKFQRSKRPRALVFQVQVGSLGIELSRAAEVAIYSPPDGWENYYQCLLRVMGPNQKRPVRYTHLLARGTLDLEVMETLRAKEDMHRVLLNDPRRFLLGMDT